MSQIVTGFCSEAGTQTQRTDHAQSFSFTRPNGDHIAVALIADGGQNERKGHMLAHIAVNSVITYLKQSVDSSIKDLLTNAVLLSNRLVMKSFRSDIDPVQQPGCSLAIAIVVNQERLYIANVGNCQIYLVRNQNINQLTVDHSFKNVAIFEDKMDYETAACNPNANEVVRTVGSKPDLEVDIGFHVGLGISAKSYQVAQTRGSVGIPLALGDSVIVASDGLGKVQNRKESLILDNELTQVVSSQTGDRGARGLVSFALGRGAQDDVSVALLQYPDPQEDPFFIPPTPSIWRSSALTIGGAATAFLMLCILTVFMFQDQAPVEALSITEEETLVAQSIIKIEENNLPSAKLPAATEAPLPAIVFASPIIKPIIEEPTPVPVAIAEAREHTVKEVKSMDEMLRPTLAPKAVGIYRVGNERIYPVVYEDEIITSNRNIEFQINHEATTDELITKMEVLPTEDTIRDASLYALWGSTLEFMQVDKQVEFRLYEESDVLIETGVYTAGARIEVRTSSEDVTFSVQDSCMAVVYSEEHHRLSGYCFAGTCQYKIGRHDSVHIPEGQQVHLNPADVTSHPAFTPITPQIAQSYRNLLLNFYSGREDSNTCLDPYTTQAPADH